MDANEESIKPEKQYAEGEKAADDQAVDISLLAGKVYRLMREELRLEKARGVGRGRSE